MKKKVVNKKKSAPKKQVKKLPKKAATVKKATKKVAKKAVKKVSEKATKKVVKKAVKKIPEKLPKEKVAKKATEEAVLSAEPEKVEEAEESPVEESKPASFGFTMDDIQTYLKENKPAKTEKVELVKATVVKKVKAPVDLVAKPKKRVLAAASIADILGFNPEDKKKTFAERKESEVPSKWLSYYRSLVKLRDHLSDDIVKHSEETLKKNSKDDSGNLSSYSQHLADAGTESFDRDMALDLVHNEQMRWQILMRQYRGFLTVPMVSANTLERQLM